MPKAIYLLCAILFFGPLPYAVEPLMNLRDGDPAGRGACTVSRQQDLIAAPNGFEFNGSSSFIHLKTPQKLTAMTLAVQAKPYAYPKGNAVLLARRGFHNQLGINAEGLPFLEVWNQEKQRLTLTAKEPLPLNQWSELAAVIRPENGKIELQLFLNGKPVAAGTLDGAPFDYQAELICGAVNPYGTAGGGYFSGLLNAIRLYDCALTAEEIAAQLLPPPPPEPAVSADGTVDVAAFGAIPDDGNDDTAAVHRAVDFAKKNHAARVIFSPGVYDFHASDAKDLYDQSHWVFFLKNVEQLELNGQGAKLMLHGLQFLIYTSESSNITLKNFTVDYSKPFFSQGNVVALAPDRRSFDIDIDPSSPVKGGEKVEAFLEMDPLTGLPAAKGLDVYYRVSSTELLAPQRLRVHMTDTIEVTPGKQILLRHNLYTASLLRFLHGKNITLENLDLHMATGMAIVGQYIENFTVRNVREIPAPGSHTQMSIPSDGLNLLGCSGNILVENSVFDGMGDDCVNIFTNYWSIKEIIDERTCIIYNEKHNSRETPQEKTGDVIDFLRADDLRAYASRTIESLKPDFKTYTAKVTFREPLPDDLKAGDDLLMKQNRLESVILRNNVFRPLRGRGVTIQVPNVLIERNRFQDSFSSGIHISTVISPWFEAGPAENVEIRDNEFINCMRRGNSKNSAVIQIGAVLRNRQANDLMTVGFNSTVGVHRNIRILNNRLLGSDNGGMVINSVKNVEVRGNLLQNLNRDPVPTWQTRYRWSENAVTMLGAHAVVFADNRYLDTEDPRKEGILAIGEGCDRAEIKLLNNRNFEVRYAPVLPGPSSR